MYNSTAHSLCLFRIIGEVRKHHGPLFSQFCGLWTTYVWALVPCQMNMLLDLLHAWPQNEGWYHPHNWSPSFHESCPTSLWKIPSCQKLQDLRSAPHCVVFYMYNMLISSLSNSWCNRCGRQMLKTYLCASSNPTAKTWITWFVSCSLLGWLQERQASF